MAGSAACYEERCPILFDSPRFVEGTYAQRNHLCFLERKVDEGCAKGECYTKRKIIFDNGIVLIDCKFCCAHEKIKNYQLC